jgi:predicted outer membrane repeat protein
VHQIHRLCEELTAEFCVAGASLVVSDDVLFSGNVGSQGGGIHGEINVRPETYVLKCEFLYFFELFKA